GAARTRPDVDPAAEPAGGLAVEVQVEERARALVRRIVGLRHREPVEPSAELEAAAAARDLERAHGRRREGEQRDRHRDRVEPPGGALYTSTMDERALQKDLDRQIATTHRRFVKAMEGRVPTMSLETKERYFAVLSTLVGKLESPEKPMREVMQEMMSEAASLILQELQSS